MFQLLTSFHKEQIDKLVKQVGKVNISVIVQDINILVEKIRADIPEKKRISYGRYSVIKKMGLELYPLLLGTGVPVFDFALDIFNNPAHDQFVRSMAVQLVSIYGEYTGDLEKVLPVFELAAMDEHWEVRECSAGFVGKLTKRYPVEMHEWYLQMVKSNDPLKRRFASESLRPVSDNRWLHEKPKFAFSVIKHLFKEQKPYPRTSVGNNLSDWMRVNEKMTWEIVKRLVKNGNMNSRWIAYRACRNMVKKDPVKVMDMFGVDEYKYKDKIYFRNDSSR